MSAEPPTPRVLIVDDGLEILEMLAALLRQEGYAVETAVDGPSALEACKRQVPDLVLLDLQLPGLDGFQVLSLLKADPRTAAASVVVVSGSLAERDIVRALEHGATDYVAKPYAVSIFLARVRAVLRSRREKEAVWRLGEDLRKAQEELSRARRSAAIGAIAAGLAHEINNPAAFVVTDLHEMRELAEEWIEGGDEARGEALAALADEALDGMNRIRDAVRDLSVFTEVVDRRSVPSTGAIDLAEIVHRRVERMGPGVTVREGEGPALVAPGLGGADELDALVGLVLRDAVSYADSPAQVSLERGPSLVDLRVSSTALSGEPPPDLALTLAIARELAERFAGTIEQGLAGWVLRLPTARGS